MMRRSHLLQDSSAVGAGHTECVGVLLAAGSLVDAVTTSGSTALHSAASNGHHEVVQHLVAAGADVDVQVRLSPSLIPSYLTIF